ncbi:MAG: molybdopterin-dependent oxidoreductase [Candidatus Bathyarchaeia archaeon]
MENPIDSSEKIVYVSSGFCGVAGSALPIEVHVRNNKIVRCLPSIIPENVNVYEIRTSRGVFTRPNRKCVPWTPSFAHRKRLNSRTRVLYPLKRIDWNPENRNPQNRGKSGYVRISWDEALDIIVKEIDRIRQTYGSTEPILVMADGHGQSGYIQTTHSWAHHLFNALGSGWTIVVRNPDSWEGYYYGAKHVWGFDSSVGEPSQDAIWDDILENCEMVIFSGCDPETTVPGFAGQIGTFFCDFLKKAGIKIIGISPDLNYAEAIHADKWVPIKPNTDAALYLAIAYVWITEDTYDKEYIETHCVGFEEFKRYVLGEEDGIPKTPEWAENITGVSSWVIRALARTWAKKRTSLAVHYGGPKQRGFLAHMTARIEAYLLAMQGLGKPGRQFLRVVRFLPGLAFEKLPPVPQYPESAQFGKGIPSLPVCLGYVSSPPLDKALPIIKTLVAEAILNPPVYWYGKNTIVCSGDDQFKLFRYPPRDNHPGIKMIWNENSCLTQCWNHGYRMIEAFRSPKIELIVSVTPWLENDALFADIILPAQTIFEHEDLINIHHSDMYGIAYQDKAVAPLGESKSDYEIYRMLAERLGVADAFPPPEELMKKAYEETMISREISWEDFKKKKLYIYSAPTWEEWIKIKKEIMGFEEHEGGMAWFYKKGSGLTTPTGKIEFVSQRIQKYAPGDKERPPLAKWVEHEESSGSLRSKRYPFIVVSAHPRWRHHTIGDDIPWLWMLPSCKIMGPDGYFYEPVWIHPVDAAKKGIKHGDITMVYNDRGAVLFGAYVTERIIPGALLIQHGSHLDIISLEDKVDRGGAINLICPSPYEKYKAGEPVRIPEMVVTGFLADIRKVDRSELEKLLKKKGQYGE